MGCHRIRIPTKATHPCSGIPILLQIPRLCNLRRSHRFSAIQIPTQVLMPIRIKIRLPILEEACLDNRHSSHRQAEAQLRRDRRFSEIRIRTQALLLILRVPIQEACLVNHRQAGLQASRDRNHLFLAIQIRTRLTRIKARMLPLLQEVACLVKCRSSHRRAEASSVT